MGTPPVRDMEAFMRKVARRLTLLERRLTRTKAPVIPPQTPTPVTAGPGIAVSGAGTSGSPWVVSRAANLLTRRTSTAGQAITTSFATVDWNNAVASSGHFSFNASTDTFTCSVAGTYCINTQVSFTAPATDSNARIQIQVNGTAVVEGVLRRSTSQPITIPVTATVVLAVGDTVRVQVTGSTASGNLGTEATRQFIELVPC